MKRQSRHLRILSLVAALLLSFPLIQAAVAEGAALTQTSRRLQEVAAKANQATVGIYCETTAYLHFYGTGVVISPDGYILTSTTVVPPGAREIQIHFTNQTRLPASLIEFDEELESALLKVNATEIAHVPLADELPSVGEAAYTLGNAHNMIRLGKNASFSVGIISGVYPVRSIDSQSSYAGIAIETDAAINPGQDGGPLLNSRGQLAGIISLSYSPRRWQGVAVPVTRIRARLKSFQEGKIEISESALIAPLPDQGPSARGLPGHARGMHHALVGIEVKRTYEPEQMPRRKVKDYLAAVDNFDELNDDAKRLLVSGFYQADNLLATNQHVRRPPGLTTGIVVAPDGYILTSLFNLAADRIWIHREDGLQEPQFDIRIEEMTAFDKEAFRTARNRVKSIHVVLPDKRRLPATIVARHVPLGIALLKIDAGKLPWIDFGRLALSPSIGSACGVIGHVGGATGFTLNTGMISAEKRNRDQQFQFDALINYGNSGGLVIDRRGRVLGIALSPMTPGPTMGRIFDPSTILQWQVAPNSGVSFAARADEIRTALPLLRAGRTVEQLSGAFIGFAPATESLLSNQVELSFIVPKSPAAAGGMKKGDIVKQFNGRRVKSWKDIVTAVDTLEPGDEIQVQVMRPGRQEYVELNGTRVRNSRDLKRLFQKLDHGAAVTGRYVDTTDQILELTIKVGERQ